eukprot:4692665-Pyramimonas_sp.AAC.1
MYGTRVTASAWVDCYMSVVKKPGFASGLVAPRVFRRATRGLDGSEEERSYSEEDGVRTLKMKDNESIRALNRAID